MGRNYDTEINNWNPGEYGKDKHGVWHAKLPIFEDKLFLFANLKAHEVIEHKDGTITVSPSIKVTRYNTSIMWHGYLRSGEWERLPDSTVK